MESRVYRDIVADRPFFFCIFATLFMIVFSFTNTYMAAPYIVGDLGGSNEISVYTICFFGLGVSLGVPLGKPLIARLGLGNTFIYCLFATLVWTYLCGIAPNYPIYLIQRGILGFCSGPIYAGLRHFLITYSPPEKLPRMTSYFITILTVAPTLGAATGGVLAYEFTWRSIFFLNLIPLSFLLLFFIIRFRQTHIKIEKTPFDFVGYIFYILGVAPLLIAAVMAQQLDWYRSDILCTLTLVGIPCLGFFILWSLNHPHAILDLRMLKNFSFAFVMLNLTVLFSAYFGMIVLLSLWLKLYVNYTPYWIGISIGGMSLAGLLPWMVIEERFGKIDHRLFLGLGILLFAISSFHTSTFDEEVNFGRIAFSRVTAGLGLAMFLPVLYTVAFRAFPQEKSLDVIQFFQVVRNLSAALGAGCYDIVWQRRQVFFHERLGEKLNVFSMQTTQFFERAKFFKAPGDPNAYLGYYLQRQATALGLEDTFWLQSWILICLLVIVVLSIRWKIE